jgi:hypothetical protein
MAARKLARHKPTSASHVYYSERADGTKSYEVRHPAREGNGKRLYEVVGTGKGALARARLGLARCMPPQQ